MTDITTVTPGGAVWASHYNQVVNRMNAHLGLGYASMQGNSQLQKLALPDVENGNFVFQTDINKPQIKIDGRWYQFVLERADYDVSGTITNTLSGLPESGVTVTIPGTGQTATTDSSGHYAIADVPKGTTVALTSSKTGYNPYSGSFNIGSADGVKDFTIARRSITGNVTSSLDGSVVSGVAVEITALPRSNNSNGSGNYSLIDVPDGSHTLGWSKTGYVSNSAGITVSADLVRNIVIDPITWTVSGTVLSDATGSAISGAIVTIGTRPNVTSNGSGNYSRNTVPDGTHAVAATYSDGSYFDPYSSTVTVSGGNQTKGITLIPLERSINLGNTYSNNGSSGYTYGYEFTVSKTIRVTKLGFRNWDGSSGRSYRVKIWNSSGSQLASADVSGNTNAWHYTTLGSPITLTPGTYTLSGLYLAGPNNMPFGDGNISHEAITVTGDYQSGGDMRPTGPLYGLQCRGWDMKVQL